MSARTDLVATADGLAARAREALAVEPARPGEPHLVGGDPVKAGALAAAAKTALEAAALAEIDPAPIIAALERLEHRVQIGTFETLEIEGVAGAVDAAALALEHYMREVTVGVAVQHGYVQLRSLLQDLARDFDAAASHTSIRIAARIHTGLEDAENAIANAKREEATGGQ